MHNSYKSNKHNEFQERFKKMTDEELLVTYDKDKVKSGWVSARAQFLTALREELENRGYEYPTLIKKS